MGGDVSLGGSGGMLPFGCYMRLLVNFYSPCKHMHMVCIAWPDMKSSMCWSMYCTALLCIRAALRLYLPITSKLHTVLSNNRILNTMNHF